MSGSSSGLDVTSAPLADQILLRIAKLMQGGEEDEETCKTLDAITTLVSNEADYESDDGKALVDLIDDDGFTTILEYLDMRQGELVRGHATLTVSAYLKAKDKLGVKQLTSFFLSRVSKGTYDDYVVAFSVAASIFPVIPAVSSGLFLSDGFVQSLGPLMKRKWKSRKVEQACLEMLNAACMDTACREAVQKYCTEWLEEVINDQPEDISKITSPDRAVATEDGPLQQRLHSQNVRNLAAVVLAKLQAVPASERLPNAEKIQPATTSMTELSDMLARTLVTSEDSSKQTSIEGLAYASLRPNVKDRLANDPKFMKTLIGTLRTSAPKSVNTYGGLSILLNLTSYLPQLSEEQKRVAELKAYANAAGKSTVGDALNNDEHVAKRCHLVFQAGAVPVLVTHSQHGSPASLRLVVSIILSLSRTPNLRGQMAQQGAVRLLLHAYNVFPADDTASLRPTARALALILSSINPSLVFGGTNPQSLTSAVRPLLTLLKPDETSESGSLLPTFESLLALTNLASVSEDARTPIIRAFSTLDDLVLSSNTMVSRATVELICNLVVDPPGAAKFADGTKMSSNRINILLALADSEDLRTRLAAGGALASLTQWDGAVNAIFERERGIKRLLGMCMEEDEGLRHRGVVCVLNVVNTPGSIGIWAKEKVLDENGPEVLRNCHKATASPEVSSIAAELLQILSATSAQAVNKTEETIDSRDIVD